MRDELLTIQQAAQILGVSTKTLRRWEAKGVLVPQRTIGNQRRYSKTELTTLFQKEKGKVTLQTSTPVNTPAFETAKPEEVKTIETRNENPVVNQPVIPVYVPTPAEPETKTSLYFKATQFSGAIVGMVLFLIVTVLVLSSQQLGYFFGSASTVLGGKAQKQAVSKQSVLAATSAQPNFQLQVNVPSFFGKKVSFLDSASIKKSLTVSGLSLLTGGVKTNNADINAGKGKITASNVVYSIQAGSNISITGDKQNPTISANVTSGVSSLQGQSGAVVLAQGSGISLNGLTINNTGVLSVGGQTGDVSLTGGSGISVSGTTISNTDTGSGQNIFKTITAGGTDILASSNTDQLTFAAGSGISVTGDANSKTITIANLGGGNLSGSGTTNYLPKFTSSSGVGNSSIYDNGQVGIGTTSPQGLFSVSGGVSNEALVSFNETSGQAILTGSESGTTRFVFDANGNLNLVGGSYQVNGVSGLSQGSPSCVTTSGGIVTGFGVCQFGSEQWIVSNGALYSGNPTVDLLVGGTSTASAKFGLLNVSGGTPTASIAAAFGNGALYLTGDGTLATVDKQTLTIGSASTGNIQLANFTNNTGVLYTNGSGVLSQSAAGNSGQVLELVGSTPTWTNVNGVLNFWQDTSGVVSPINLSDDLAIGGNATSSALFQISGTTGNATTSGIFTFGGATAQVQAENGSTLTLGGTNTGNVVINSAGNIALTAQGTKLTTGGDLSVNGNISGTGTTGLSLTGANAGIGFSGANNHIISTSSGTLEIGGFNLLGDITASGQNIYGLGSINGLAITPNTGVITSGIWNGTAIGAQYGGTGVTNYNKGDLLFAGANNPASLSTLGIGGVGQILTVSGTGVPTWSNAGGSINFWQEANGALSPYNVTDDLLLGANATASAKFAFENVAGGIPTASISAGSAGNATYLTGNGTLGTTNAQTLTLGSASTGNVSLVAGGTTELTAFNNNINLGTGTNLNLTSDSHINLQTGNSQAAIAYSSSGTSLQLFNGNAGGLIQLQADQLQFEDTTGFNNDFVITNTGATTFQNRINSGNALRVENSSGTSLFAIGTTATSPVATIAANTTYAGLVVDQSGSGNLFTASESGASKFTVLNNGNVQINNLTTNGGLLYTNGSGIVAQTLSGNPGDILQSNGGGAPTWVSASNVGTNYWQLNNGALAPVQLTNDLLLGATATSAAKFAFMNVAGNNTPTASISAGNGIATYLTGNGTLGTSNGQSLNLGSSSTGNVALLPGGTAALTALANGKVGIGTTAPAANLQVVGTTTVGGTNSAGAFTVTNNSGATEFNVDTTLNGVYLQIPQNASAGTQTVNGVSLNLSSAFWNGSTSVASNYTLQNRASLTGSNYRLAFVNNASNEVMTLDQNGNLGIGATSPIAPLNVNGAYGGNAAAVVNQLNSGDIFTASAAGATKFTIANDGTLTDVKYNTNGGILFANGTNGTIAQTAAGNAGYILQSNGGGAPTWVNAASVGTNYWQLNNGAVAPANLTNDLLLGATATSSAKFAFSNVASGTPTASIAGTLANNALYVTGDGTLGTTDRQTLTIGSGSTGNIVLANTALASEGLTVASGQSLTLSGITGTNEVLYATSGTGVVTAATTGLTNQCLLSGAGGTPSWGPCDIGNSSWVEANGTIYPGNATEDLLVGGTSTASAKFAFLNVSGNTTPTASVSGITGATSLAANGIISTTNDQTLQLGSASTGNILLSPLNGAVGSNVSPITNNQVDLGTSSLAFRNIYAGSDVIVGGQSVCLANGTHCPAGAATYWDAINGVLTPKVETQDLLLGAQATSSAKFAFVNVAGGTPTASIAGSLVNNSLYITGDGSLATTNKESLTLGSLSTGNIVLANTAIANAGLTVASGNLTLSGITGNNQLLFATAGSGLVAGVTATSTPNQCLLSGASNPVWGACDTGNTSWVQANGTIYPGISTEDLLVGGTSTASAKFAFINVAGNNTPTASISGTGGNALSLTGNGTIQTANAQSLVLNPNGLGNVGIGTNAPTSMLTVNGAISVQGGKGGLTLYNQDGGQNGFQLFSINNNLFLYNMTDSATAMEFNRPNSGPNQVQFLNNWEVYSSGNVSIGNGNTSPLATLDVRPNSATQAIASISGNTNLAALVVDNTGSGDLFTASKSGASKFTVLNNGNVQINNLGLGVVQSGATGILSSSALNVGNASLITGILPVINGGSPFDQTAGAIIERNTTQDFLLGGSATISAKFAVTGINTNTPVATLSGTTGGMYLSATGNLATTNRQTLTLGGNGTGNISLQDSRLSSPVLLTQTANSLDVGLGTNGIIDAINKAYEAAGGSGSGGVWSLNGNVIFPSNIANQVGIGTSAVGNGQLVVNQPNTAGDIISASTAGTTKFVVTNNGSLAFTGGSNFLQTITSNATHAQSINIPDFGGGSTDICLVAAGNCAGSGTGVTHTGGAAGEIAYFDGGNDITGSSNFLFNSSLSVTGASGNAAGIINQLNGGDIFSASAAGATKFTIANDGTISDAKYAGNNNAVLYATSANGTLATAFTGLNNQCLLSTPSGPTWGSCDVGNSSWVEANGSIYPGNSTEDLLVGGNATASAKFAFTNVANGTPTASVSATATGTGLSLAGNGVIQSLQNETLTIGGNTTGNILLSPLNGAAGSSVAPSTNGNVDLGTSNLQFGTIYAKNDIKVNGVSVCLANGTNCQAGAATYWDSINGVLTPKIETQDILFGGQATTSAKFAFINNLTGTPTASIAGTAGSALSLSGDGTIQTSNRNLLTIGGPTNGDIAFEPGGLPYSSSLYLDSKLGTVEVGSGGLTVGGSEASLTNGLYMSATGQNQIALNTSGSGFGYIGNPSSGVWTLGYNPTNNLQTTSTSVLSWNTSGQVGIGNANTNPLATLDIKGSDATSPIASLSGATTNAGLLVDNSGTGALFTASKSGATKFVIANNGNVGIGTANPTSPLTVNGNIEITPIGGVAQNLQLDSCCGGNSFALRSATGGLNFFATADVATMDQTGALSLGIGNGTNAQLDALQNNYTLPAGYFHGSTGKATLEVNQTSNAGDLFTASLSGVSKFTVTNAGNIVASNYAGTNAVLYADANGKFTTAATGLANQCLLSGGSVPTWGACDTGNTTWVQANGTIYPGNSTEDLLVGGNSTASAKFAFINVAGNNTPTASISGTGNNALFLTGNGTLGTTNGQTLTIGSSTTGNITINPLNSVILKPTNDSLTSPDLQIKTSLGNNLLTVAADSSHSRLGFNLSGSNLPGLTGSGLDVNGALRLEGGTSEFEDTFTTPQGASVLTKINIPLYDPGASNQILAFGLPSGADAAARVLSLFDNRAGTNNQPPLALFNPLENDVIGLGWDGGSSEGYVKTMSSDIGFKSGNTVIANLKSNGLVGIGTTNPLSTLDVRADITGGNALPVASFSGQTTAASLVVDQSGTGDLFTASKSGASKFTVLNNGNLQLNNYTATNGVLYTNSTGLLQQATTGTPNLCLLSGGSTPTWGNCVAGNTAFQEAAGAIFASNTTEDFLLGGSSTASAKFAFINVAGSNVPTASISGTAGNALALTGNGTIQTADAQSLLLNPNGFGNVGIGLSNPQYPLSVNGQIQSTGSNAELKLMARDNSGNSFVLDSPDGSLQFYSPNGPGIVGAITQGGKFGIGVNNYSPLAQLDVQGTSLGTGILPVASISGNTSFATTVIDQSGSGDIFTASKSGASKFTITNAGNILAPNYAGTNAVLYADANGKFTTAATGLANQCLLSGGSVPTWGACDTGNTTWIQTNGTIYPGNSTEDLLVGGTSTASAKFAFINVAANTPTASISASTGTAISLGADGSIQTTQKGTLTLGGTTTGDIQFKPGNASNSLYLASNGNVGIGTPTGTWPDQALEVHGNIDIAGAGAPPGSGITGLGMGYSSGNYAWLQSYGSVPLVLNPLNNAVGIGTTSPLATLDVRFNTGSTAVASFSGNTALATEIVNQRGTGDIFTASKSGSTKFVIDTNGNVGIGTPIPANTLSIMGGTLTNGNANTYAFGVGNSGSAQDLTLGSDASYAYIQSWGNKPLQINAQGANNTLINPNGASVGIGTTSPLAKLDVRGNSGTTPTASFAANSTFAGLVVDQTGTGNIFTASAAGAMKFAIDTAGSLIFGGANENTFTTTLKISAPTASRTITLPNNSGTIALNTSGSATGGTSAFVQGGQTWNTAAVLGTQDSNALQLITSNATRLQIDTNGNVGIGTTNALATLDVRGNIGTNPIASFSGATTNAAVIVDQSGSGDLFTASKSGASKFTILNNGNIQLNNYTGSNGILYTTSTGVLQQATTGSSNLCLLSGATPTWGACDTGNTTWVQANGAIYPGNSTEDLLIGGTSTASAKFAFINVSGSNTPTASISGTGGNALSLSGNGTIQTANAQSLLLNPNGFGNVAIGTTAQAAKFYVAGNSAADIADFYNSSTNRLDTINQFGDLTLDGQAQIYANTLQSQGNGLLAIGGNTTGAITFQPQGLNSGQSLYLASNGTAGIGTTSPLATLDVRALSGTLPVASVSGATSKAAVIVDNSGSGDLFTASKSGASKFTVLNNGNVQINNFTQSGGVLYSNSTGVLSQSATGNSGQVLQLVGGTPTWVDAGAAGITYWQLNGNAISPIGSIDDLLLGGSSTSSAKFAFINNAAGIPTASIAATPASGTTNGLSLAGNGTLQSLNDNDLTIGGNTTGNITLAPLNGSGTVTLNGSGGLNLVNGGINFITAFSNIFGSDLKIWGKSNTPIYLQPAGSTTGTVGIGVSSANNPLATLDVRGQVATSPIASLSGATTNASLIVDQSGTGDILSASKSGATKFVINNAGNIVAPNYNGNNAVLYGTAGTGQFATAVTNTAGQCLLSGAGNAPAWGACDSGNTSWVQANGTIYPGNSTEDLLVGGTSTASAKFAFINVAGSNTPTASISGANNNATYLTATGTLATTNKQTLNLGSSTTGNIVFTPGGVNTASISNDNNGTFQLTDNTDGALFNVYNTLPSVGSHFPRTFFQGGSSTSDSNWLLRFADAFSNSGNPITAGFQISDTNDPSYTSTNNLSVMQSTTLASFQTSNTESFDGTAMEFTTSGSSFANPNLYLDTTANGERVGIGTTAPAAQLDVEGLVGTNPVGYFNGNTAKAALIVNNSGSGDLFTASQAGSTKFVISHAGNVGIGTSLPGYPLDVNGIIAAEGTANTTELYSAGCGSCFNYGALEAVSTGLSVPAGLDRPLKLQLSGGSAGLVSIGPGMANIDPAATLDVRGANATLPVASFSGRTTNAGVIVDQSGSGDIFTASKSGLTKFVITNNGNVGIGIPGANFTTNQPAVNDNPGGNNLITAGDIQVGDKVAGFGTVELTPNGSGLFGGTGLLDFYDGNGNGNGEINGNGGVLNINAMASSYIDLSGGYGGLTNIGINTPAAPLSTLDVRGNVATNPIASFSGATTNASVIVDQSGSGDIFTASKSGATKFVIANNGNVGIGTANPGYLFTIKPTVSGQDTFVVNQSGTNNPGLVFRSYSNGGQMAFYNGVDQQTLINGAGPSFFESGVIVGSNSTALAQLDIRGANDPNNSFNNGNAGTVPSASISAQSSMASVIVDQDGSGDIFTASKSGATKFTINNAGNIIAPNYAGNNAVLYAAAGTGAFTTATTSSSGLCLLSGAGNAPSWGSCVAGNTTFQQANGAIYAGNTTEDLLLGGTSTSSAKFAFINVTSGTPTASIAAVSTPNAISFDANGNIGTTARQQLTFGTATTGNISLAPEGITVLTASASAGSSSIILPSVGAGSQTAFQVLNNSTQLFTVDTSGNHVIVGGVNGCTGNAGRLCVNQSGAASSTFTTQNGTTTVTGSGSGGTATGNALFLTDTSTGGGATLQGFVVDSTNSTNASSTINSIIAKVPSGQSGNFLQFLNGSTTEFQLTNSGSASLAGQLAFTTTPQLQATNRQTLTLGGNTTGDITFQPGGVSSGTSLYLGSNGNVGIGTNQPGAKLAVVGNGTGTALLGDAGLGSNYTGISLNGTLSSTNYNFLSSPTDSNLYINRPSANDMVFRAGNNTQAVLTSAGYFGVGVASNLAGTLDIRGQSATLPIASFSGATTNASVIVDQSGSGDIFTASKSGLTQFTVKNNGQVVVGSNTQFGATLSNGSVYKFLAGNPTQGNDTRIGVTSGANAGVFLGSDGNIARLYGFNYGNSTPLNLALNEFGGGIITGAAANTSPKASLDVRSISGTLSVASVSGATTFANMVVDQSGTGDIFTASKSGATKFTINNAGNIIAPNYAGNNAVLYAAAGTGAFTTATTGSGGLCLLSQVGGAPQWGNCVTGNTTWQEANGTIYAGNSTEDLLLGGSATTSAGFAVTGIAGTTPRASISAVRGNKNGISIDASTSTIQSLNRNTLTLGGSTTGDINFQAGTTNNALYLASSGNVGVGTSVPVATFQVGAAGQVANPAFIYSSQYNNAAGFANYTGNWFNSGNWGIGPATGGVADNLLRIGITSNNGLNSWNATQNLNLVVGGAGSFGLGASNTAMGNAALTVNQAYAGGDIFSASQSGTTKFVIDNIGDVLIGARTSSINNSGLQIGGNGGSANPRTLFLDDYQNGGGQAQITGNWNNNTGWGVGTATSTSGDQSLRLAATSDALGSWSNSIPDLKLMINGPVNTAAAANLDVRSVGSTMPIASFSGKTSFAGLVVDNSGSGDIFTASKSGATKFVITNAGNVGIGTTNPVSLMDLESATNVFTDTSSSVISPDPASYNLLIRNTTGTNNTGQGIAFMDSTTMGQTLGASIVEEKASTNNHWLQFYTRQNGSLTEDLALDSNGNVGIGNNFTPTGKSILATLDIRGNSGTTPFASISGATTNASVIVDQSGSGDIFTASKSGATKFTINNAGNIVAPNYAGNNAVLYAAAGTGAFTTTTTSSSGLCLLSGAGNAPSWGNCVGGNTTWQEANGAIYAGNTTEDLILGSSATASAGFAVTGIAGTTPQATISAVRGNKNGISLDASTSTIQSLNKNTLTLGGSTTGNIQFKPGNNANSLYLTGSGTVGIGTTSPVATLDIRGNSGTTPVASISGRTALASMFVDQSGSGDIFTASKSGKTIFTITNAGNVKANGIIETGDPTGNGNAGFQIDSNQPGAGTVQLYSATGDFNFYGNTADVGALSGGSGQLSLGINNNVFNAQLYSIAQDFTLPNGYFQGSTGVAAVMIDQQNNSGDLFTASRSGTPMFTVTNAGGIKLGPTEGIVNQCLLSGGAGNAATWGSCAQPLNYLQLNNGAIAPFSQTLDFLFGGTNPTATTSAGFHLFGTSASGTTPVASIGAKTSFASMVVSNNGSGDIFTASSSGFPRVTITNAGNLIVANTTRAGAFGSIGKIAVLNDNPNGKALTLQAAPGQTADIFDIYNSSGSFVSGYDQNGNETLTQNLNFSSSTGNTTGLINSSANQNISIEPGSGLLGINVGSNFLASLDVRAGNATKPVASVSGATTNAGIVIDQSGTGDIFTASKSGATKFTIQNSGTVVIGNNTNGMTFDPTGNTGCGIAGFQIFCGTARPVKTITMTAEYPGVILSASPSAGLNTNGFMTSDASYSATPTSFNHETYYQWTSTTSTAMQSYNVGLTITLPKDFSDWPSSGNALTIDFNTGQAGNGDNALDVYMYQKGDTSGIPVAFKTNQTTTAKTWTQLTFTKADLTGNKPWNATNRQVTLYLGLKARNNTANYVQVGDINLNYLSGF